MSKTANTPKRRRRLPQWSMATMFVGVTIVCVLAGLVVPPAQEQERAFRPLRSLDGVKILYDYETATFDDGSRDLFPIFDASPPGPDWLSDWIGVDYVADVVGVELDQPQNRDEALRRMRFFSQIEMLVLRANDDITDVGLENLGRLTNLKCLLLSDAKLPPKIGQLSKLTSLGVIDAGLTEIPPEICELTKLTNLCLEQNKFTTLPPEIARLTKLTRLDLEVNQLTTLPPEIGKLVNLTMLDLGVNKLSALPSEIWKLTKLKDLFLNDNQLTMLPPEIGKLTKLTRLSLGRNQINTLPPEIGKLSELTILWLDGNPIFDADLLHLKSLKKLEVLSLRGTKVTKAGIAALKRSLPNWDIKREF